MAAEISYVSQHIMSPTPFTPLPANLLLPPPPSHAQVRTCVLLPADMHEPYGSVTTVACCPPGTILSALADATQELNRRVLSRAGEVPGALLMSATLSCLRLSGCISSWLDSWLDMNGRPVSYGKLPRVDHVWDLP
jgi:hypothetical protein